MNIHEYIISALCCIQFECIVCQVPDPCSDTVYTKIEGEDKRSPDYEINFGADLAYSDDRLTAGWYRIISDAGDQMPTSAPAILHCGTIFPIWLQDTLPTSIGVTESKTVCLVGYDGECSRTWTINIRLCSGSYFVYELQPSPITEAGYCFGSSSPCPDGTSSETGYGPRCSGDFPSISISPVVESGLEDGDQEYFNTGVFNVEPVFKCTFTDTGNSYYYDVHWFINGNSVEVFKQVLFNNIDTTYLRPRHWVAAYDMNMEVICSIRVRTTENSVPSPHHTSSNFTAGVVADSYQHEVTEGNSTSITIRSTVPLGCRRRIDLGSCRETIKVSFPFNESCIFDNSIGRTTGFIVEQACGVEIYGDDWSSPKTLTVHGNIDNLYNQNSVRYAAISLSKADSITDRSNAWQTLIIPDIIVYVKDKDTDLRYKLCESFTDPNYITFDGKYYGAQISGEYVLYRHKREPIWVHTLSSRFWWAGTCNVGIAIRSHDTLFVVRTVDEVFNPLDFANTVHDYTATVSGRRTYPFVDYRHCDDQNMRIQRTGMSFKVKLPTGTEVSFVIRRVFLDEPLVVNDILIKPSVLDIDQTEGLCGLLNSDRSDDFRERGSNNVVALNDFIGSWSISNTSDESLFSPNPTLEKIYPFRPFCVCGENVLTTAGILSNVVHCNLTQPREQCYNTETTSSSDHLYTRCSDGSSVDKRSLDDSDEVVDTTILRYSPEFVEGYIPEEPQWHSGWTEETARRICTQSIYNLTSLPLCTEFAGTDPDNFIKSCMTDIKITGSAVLIQGSIQTMISACLIEVSRNETLMLTDDRESTGSLLESIKAQLCLNNCSGNGVCDNVTSICKCNEGFVGDYCSKSKSSPPQNYTLPAEGQCGIKSRSCQRTFVYGMFETEELWCRLEYFQIVDNIKTPSVNTEVVRAEFISFNSVTCPLVTSSRRRKRSADINAEGYDISLSYDGVNFGEETSIIIYDEQCYSCDSSTLTCTQLSTCQSTTTVSSSTVLSTDSPSGISLSDDLQTTTLPSDLVPEKRIGKKERIPIIISCVLGVILLVVILVLCGYFKYKQKLKSKKNSDAIVYSPPPCGKRFDAERSNQPPSYESQFGSTKPPSYVDSLRRSGSAVSNLNLEMTWADNRPTSPDHLFVAPVYKK